VTPGSASVRPADAERSRRPANVNFRESSSGDQYFEFCSREIDTQQGDHVGRSDPGMQTHPGRKGALQVKVTEQAGEGWPSSCEDAASSKNTVQARPQPLGASTQTRQRNAHATAIVARSARERARNCAERQKPMQDADPANDPHSSTSCQLTTRCPPEIHYQCGNNTQQWAVSKISAYSRYSRKKFRLGHKGNTWSLD
jgi:hypothetical protein